MGKACITVRELDAAREALDRLEFVRVALADSDDGLGSERATSGACAVMAEALEVLGSLVGSLEADTD